MDRSIFTDGIYLVDFEFYPKNSKEGNPPIPVCMVVREWPSGHTLRFWQSDLDTMNAAPFPVRDKALLVAYFASAELDCFHSLGWPLPINVLDLYAEFRRYTNGLYPAHGSGLLGALLHFGLPSMGGEQKTSMRDLILSGGPWNAGETLEILDYCESDVTALDQLLSAMLEIIDLPYALLRGRYIKAVSSMQMVGIPIDVNTLCKLKLNWTSLQDQLIEAIDKDYGIFEGRTFKHDRFENYLIANGIPWPRLDSGKLDLRDDTFREMSKAHPKIAPLRELRSALSEMRLTELYVGEDGRNRCLLSPFQSKTGRNQPSTTKFIFGPSVWLRGLIQPQPGWGLAYVCVFQGIVTAHFKSM